MTNTHTRFDDLEPLTEHVADWRAEDLQVDTGERVVRNVVLSGAISKNGHRYTPEALQQAAVLYERKPVFLDHAPNAAKPFERSTRDLVGTILAARYEEGRIRGDIQVLDTEAGRTFLALIESQQPSVGMSHVVLAQRGTNPQIVENIHDVVSVDAVVFPATTQSLREAQTDDDERVRVLQEQLREAAGEVERLREALAARDCSAAVDALIAAAGLPSYAISPLFREQLRGTTDMEQRRRLIQERQTLIQRHETASVVSRPRGTSRDPDHQAFIRAIRGTPIGVLSRPM
ncbi:MAG: hypothetical protein B7Z55_00985 [Planctomycetales bacterium 12-60-4]|nr:MAG: hypothetical protein B7Z55_00985 [Planctomycetales bacterium 12-60-4]